MFLVLLLVSLANGYQRLSTDAYPKKYHLVLRPSFTGDFAYHGNLSIQMVMNNTDTFSLDCQGLNVTWSSLMFDYQWPVTHTKYQQNDRLVVKTQQKMKDTYQIEFNLTFSGNIRQDMSGFYMSRYEYEGKQRLLASTHFESSSARKAFPCFDEPSFRADFNLEIVVDPKMNAISNSPSISNTVQNSSRRIVFAERKSTPTYLVAWVIYEIDSFGNTSKNVKTNCNENNSINYNVWYNMEYENETELALRVAPQVVSTLENFTGIKCEAVKYKMDLVAIPDFDAGAMENWELITFRESRLLYNNVSSSIIDKQLTIMILAHELTHQWFGNLVTPNWWSYIWLNEGFARYLQYVIADQLYPEMKLNEQFLIDRRQNALMKDDSSAHPLTDENLSKDNISDMFDVITYDKGASVIHMWRSTLGYGEFKTGINNYLNNVVRYGGVTNPTYLFSALFDNTLSHDKLLGTTWTEQNGYPIIVASEGNSNLTLKQIKIKGWNQTEEGSWMIPLTINMDNKTFVYTMKPNQTLTIDFDKKSTYVINYNQTGYYRVMYSNTSRWYPVNPTETMRSMLIDDALALSKAGLVPYRISMNVASQHLKSMSYLPWASGLKAFRVIHDVLKTTEYEPKWRALVLNLLDDVMKNVALNDSKPENHILIIHKINLLKNGCYYGHKGCLEEANKLASNLSNGTPEKRTALLCTVVKTGDDKIWNRIYGLYNSSKSPTEKQLYLKALTCTLNRKIIQNFLQLMLTREIRKQDVTITIDSICESPEGAEETLNFFQNNYVQLYNYFGDWKTVKKILISATKFITDSQLKQIRGMDSIPAELNMKSILNKLEQQIIMKKHTIRMISDYFTPDRPETTTKNIIETTTDNVPDTDNASCKINVKTTWIISFLAIYALRTFNVAI